MAQKRKLEEVEEFNSVSIVAKIHSIVAKVLPMKPRKRATHTILKWVNLTHFYQE